MMATAFTTDFEDADTGLAPNPYNAIVAAGANTCAKAPSFSGLGSSQKSVCAGVLTDAYGGFTLATDLVAAVAPVVFQTIFYCPVLPGIALMNTGFPIFRLRSAGAHLATVWFWRNGSANAVLRGIYTPTAGNVNGTTVLSDGQVHRIQVVLDGTAGAEKMLVYLDGALEITINAVAPHPDSHEIRVGPQTGSLIPDALSEYWYDNVALFQTDQFPLLRGLPVNLGLSLKV